MVVEATEPDGDSRCPHFALYPTYTTTTCWHRTSCSTGRGSMHGSLTTSSSPSYWDGISTDRNSTEAGWRSSSCSSFYSSIYASSISSYSPTSGDETSRSPIPNSANHGATRDGSARYSTTVSSRRYREHRHLTSYYRDTRKAATPKHSNVATARSPASHTSTVYFSESTTHTQATKRGSSNGSHGAGTVTASPHASDYYRNRNWNGSVAWKTTALVARFHSATQTYDNSGETRCSKWEALTSNTTTWDSTTSNRE